MFSSIFVCAFLRLQKTRFVYMFLSYPPNKMTPNGTHWLDYKDFNYENL